jgi:hypothetical protein
MNRHERRRRNRRDFDELVDQLDGEIVPLKSTVAALRSSLPRGAKSDALALRLQDYADDDPLLMIVVVKDGRMEVTRVLDASRRELWSTPKRGMMCH